MTKYTFYTFEMSTWWNCLKVVWYGIWLQTVIRIITQSFSKQSTVFRLICWWRTYNLHITIFCNIYLKVKVCLDQFPFQFDVFGWLLVSTLQIGYIPHNTHIALPSILQKFNLYNFVHFILLVSNFVGAERLLSGAWEQQKAKFSIYTTYWHARVLVCR